MQPILTGEAFSALSQHYNEYLAERIENVPTVLHRVRPQKTINWIKKKKNLAEPHAYFYAGIPPSTRSVPWEDSLLDKYVERTSWTSLQLFKPV
jgi:hypothetical protein